MTPGGKIMVIGAKEDRWKVLCAQAASEQDPRKLVELVTEINRLLGANEDRTGVTPEVEE
jgi:hypothetical protein